jgi:hypothetical protein
MTAYPERRREGGRKREKEKVKGNEREREKGKNSGNRANVYFQMQAPLSLYIWNAATAN